MKRVLAIDGGGLKGVYPASFLATVEEIIEQPIADYFDLIVGTSTGGIIALGLGMGLTAKEILDFYVERGPHIFTGNHYVKLIRQLGRAKYNSAPLQQALQDVFGERRLGDSRTRLVVPSLNLETGEVHVYKTAHHPRFVMDYKLPVVEVAMATAAAPTYFPTYRSTVGIPLVDGGTWANNPAGVAAVEALGVLEWRPGEVQVLSLGCTTEPLRVKAKRRRLLGVNYWARRLLPVIMAGQSSGSLGTAQLLLGHENVLRYSVTVSSKRFRLDSAGDIQALLGLGVAEARRAMPRLQGLLSEKAEPFVPYRKLDTQSDSANEEETNHRP